MLDFLKTEANNTYTENGEATYISTKSDCLDLFATIGALRHASDEDIIFRFTRAYAENADLAMKIYLISPLSPMLRKKRKKQRRLSPLF